jgi:hypothetical protein
MVQSPSDDRKAAQRPLQPPQGRKDGLVSCSPCAHGKKLSVSAAPDGSLIFDPNCKDGRGHPRPHILRAGESHDL